MNHATTTPAHSVPKAHTTAASTGHASKRYRTDSAEVVALNNVTVDFERARFTAIMGPSGSGKSALLPCLAGLDTLSSGQANVGGTDLATLSDRTRTPSPVLGSARQPASRSAESGSTRASSP